MKIIETIRGVLILEAQNEKEMSCLNGLVLNGKAMNSGEKYQVLVSLKDNKHREDLEKFLKAKGFGVS